MADRAGLGVSDPWDDLRGRISDDEWEDLRCVPKP